MREKDDIASLEDKLSRSLSVKEKSRIGVSKLRLFLEELLQKRYLVYFRNAILISFLNFFFLLFSSKISNRLNFHIVRYMDSVPLIIPLLEKEYRTATRKLTEVNHELR